MQCLNTKRTYIFLASSKSKTSPVAVRWRCINAIAIAGIWRITMPRHVFKISCYRNRTENIMKHELWMKEDQAATNETNRTNKKIIKRKTAHNERNSFNRNNSLNCQLWVSRRQWVTRMPLQYLSFQNCLFEPATGRTRAFIVRELKMLFTCCMIQISNVITHVPSAYTHEHMPPTDIISIQIFSIQYSPTAHFAYIP